MVGIGVAIWLVGSDDLLGGDDSVSCSYEGAPRNLLEITVTGTLDGELRRAGNQIVVAKDAHSQEFCDGGTPTVYNTDTIRVKLDDFSSLEVWLGGGPFEPGATPERDGASEIEIVGSGSDGSIDVVGTPYRDTWQWGRGRDAPGLNLDAGTAGDRDVDVTITGENAFISASPGGGDDTVGADPASDDLSANAVGVVSGGVGDDVLHAPANAGGEIDGGPGDDRITGGPRHDEIDGDAGNDVIDVRGGGRDTVNCGPGRDRVRADLIDIVRNCEDVRR